MTNSKSSASALKQLPRALRIGIVLMVVVLVLAFPARMIFGYPIPVIDTVFGPYHVYSQASLSNYLQKVPLEGNMTGMKYHGSCSFEGGAITLTGQAYRCASNLSVAFTAEDICKNYVSVFNAMASAGYHYSSATEDTLSVTEPAPQSYGTGPEADCEAMSRNVVYASYVNQDLIKFSHGTGRVDCFFPELTTGVIQSPSNTYSCDIEIDTDQLSNPPTT